MSREFASRASAGLALICLSCEPSLVVGSWNCGSADGPDAVVTEDLALPWETGFEDGFCGYTDAGGYCVVNPEAASEIVTSPVRSGTRAAAFRVAGDYPEIDGLQARCARHGVLPEAAYYGAWFYVSDPVTSTDGWNLFHFDGNGKDVEHYLWDVSLELNPNGLLRAYVFDFLRMTTRPIDVGGEVPVGKWFHLEVYWVRAADPTGVFELYVDGVRVLSLTNLVTDDSESGEWYVGNLATILQPRPNTLYVDDVTISATRRGGT